MSSHLFQRVASFLLMRLGLFFNEDTKEFSSLSESGFIPTTMSKKDLIDTILVFSSLSESGFIPTMRPFLFIFPVVTQVLISFREWLHSYHEILKLIHGVFDRLVLISFREWLHSYTPPSRVSRLGGATRSHLFQRVASFLQVTRPFFFIFPVVSSHLFQRVASFLQHGTKRSRMPWNKRFSSLSESGFIPTWC